MAVTDYARLGGRPRACWQALKQCAAWSHPAVVGNPKGGAGDDHSPQGVGTDEAGIAKATRADGCVEVEVSGMVVWI